MTIDPPKDDKPMSNSVTLPANPTVEAQTVQKASHAYHTQVHRTASRSDSVSVSKTASELSAAIAKSHGPHEAPAASAARLAALRHTVQTGSLAIDTMSLAHAIMREETSRK